MSDERLKTLLTENPYWTVRAMQEQGSRFYRALGAALEAADATNRQLICATWLEAVWDFRQRGQHLAREDAES